MPNPKSTTLIVMGPTVELRLSRAELDGLRYGCYILRWHLSKPDILRSDFELTDRLHKMSLEVLRLAGAKKCQTIRVHADVFALAALAFGLRSIPREIRRGRISIRWPANTDYRKLLRRLERYRRRAKNRWFKLGSTECYRRRQRRWQTFLKGVNRKRPREKNLLRARFQQRVDDVLTITKEVLVGQAPNWVPLDSDLRPMVRAALRHVRRERAPITMKEIIYDTPAARSFLAEFVGQRVRALFWRRVHELEAKEPLCPEENDEAFAAVRDLARDKGCEEMIRRNLYPQVT